MRGIYSRPGVPGAGAEGRSLCHSLGLGEVGNEPDAERCVKEERGVGPKPGEETGLSSRNYTKAAVGGVGSAFWKEATRGGGNHQQKGGG